MSHVRCSVLVCTAAVFVGTLSPPVLGQLQPTTRYCLFEGTYVLEGWGLPVPLRGSFYLVPDETSPSRDCYRVNDFYATSAQQPVTVTGHGEYWIGGELITEQRMELDLTVNNIPDVHFDSGVVTATSRFPMIEIHLLETPPPPARQLHVIGGPIRRAWFSTEVPFDTQSGREISDGDLLSNSGRIIRTYYQLARNLGIMPPTPDIGLDALHPQASGALGAWEQCFSAEVTVFSETLGWLRDGDFLSEGGYIVAHNEELLHMFAPIPPENAGLDAITWGWPCDGWYFSTETDFFSQSLGTWCRHGELLCARDGMVAMTNEHLLRNFNPSGVADRGLDAVYLWPGGEVWFSLEEGFQDRLYGWISDGDLLSDSGWVVHRNPEMIARFDPAGVARDVGLDAIYILPFRKGDLNCDGAVNGADIDPFFLALGDPAAYNAAFRFCDIMNGDMNGDEAMNGADIDPFFECLGGGGCP